MLCGCCCACGVGAVLSAVHTPPESQRSTSAAVTRPLAFVWKEENTSSTTERAELRHLCGMGIVIVIVIGIRIGIGIGMGIGMGIRMGIGMERGIGIGMKMGIRIGMGMGIRMGIGMMFGRCRFTPPHPTPAFPTLSEPTPPAPVLISHQPLHGYKELLFAVQAVAILIPRV